MSLDDIDTKLKTFQFLLDSIPIWVVSINTILDNTPQRIADDQRDTRSSSHAITTPALSAQEDTTVECSSIEPISAPTHLASFNLFPNQSHNCPVTYHQHPASHSPARGSSSHKRKRSASPAVSERSCKQNRYRLYNSLRVKYDGDAQHSLENIVKAVDKAIYTVRKSCEHVAADGAAEDDESRRTETVLEALKFCTDNCYGAALQLLKDGTSDEQLKPVLEKFDVIKANIHASFSASPMTQVQHLAPLSPFASSKPATCAAAATATATAAATPAAAAAAAATAAAATAAAANLSLLQPLPPHKPQDRAVDVEVEVDDEDDDEEELAMSKIAHRLTSRMAKV